MNEAFPVERFRGLALKDDPGEVGAEQAIDLANVDFDKEGRVRSRDGLLEFVPSESFYHLSPFYTTAGLRYLIGSNVDKELVAYDFGGNVIDTQAMHANATANTDMARFAAPGSEFMYIANGAEKLWQFDHTNGFTAPTFTGDQPIGFYVGVTPWDNRLVNAGSALQPSRVLFSDEGNPLSFPADNNVDLHPGDGDAISGVVQWREMLFVFKQDKYFVFYGTSTDQTGGPVFDYRAVDSQVGSTRDCACASRDAVYFVHRSGLYKTTGGLPVLLSRNVEPLFRASAPSSFGGSAVSRFDDANVQFQWRLHYFNDRLYFSYASTDVLRADRTLVYDIREDRWSYWSFGGSAWATYRVTTEDEIVVSVVTASGGALYRHNSTYTDDDGTAIDSHYRSGFYDMGTPAEKTSREQLVYGSGAPSLQMFTNYSTTGDAASTVTLGTAPAVVEGRRRTAVRGHRLSHRLASVSGGAWSANRIEHLVGAGRLGGRR